MNLHDCDIDLNYGFECADTPSLLQVLMDSQRLIGSGVLALALSTISILRSHSKLQAFLASCMTRLGAHARLSSAIKLMMRAFWGFDLFCAELDNLVDHFELRKVGFSIYGPSWGGMLASIYSGRKSRGLHKLVIANSCPSAALSAKERGRLFRLFPVIDAVMQMDADGEYDIPAYQEACERFSKKHFCILEPWPAVLTEASWENSTRMWKTNGKKGISLIRQPGFMHDYDAIKTAKYIEVPALLLSVGTT